MLRCGSAVSSSVKTSFTDLLSHSPFINIAYVKMRFGGIKYGKTLFSLLVIALTFHQHCIRQDAVGRLEKKSISTLRH